MSIIKTYITLSDSTNVEISAEYYYQPAEREEGERGFSLGYPGCPAMIEEIYEIEYVDADKDFLELFNKDMLNEKQVELFKEEIETNIWEVLKEEHENSMY